MDKKLSTLVGLTITATNIVAIATLMHLRHESKGIVSALNPAHLDSQNAATSISPAQTHAVAPQVRRVPASTPSTQVQQVRQKAWEKFRDLFGRDLTATFLPDGKIASINRPAGASAKKAHSKFNVQDREEVIARAEEILRAAEELIGTNSRLPLKNPQVKQGGLTLDGRPRFAEVSFEETFNDLPLAPYGSVTVQLDGEGELRALYSHYLDEVQVGNKRVMDSASAKDYLRSQISGDEKIKGGRSVIWLDSTDTTAQARYAYEFYVNGVQTIVGAEPGEKIERRDRKTH